MTHPDHRGRLDASSEPRGAASRTLSVAGFAWRLVGLDDELAAALDRRWGPFLGRDERAEATVVEVVDGGSGGWLPAAAPGEHYRLEPLAGAGPGVVSYAFAAASFDASRVRLALDREATEPAERSVDNVARWLVARRVLASDGMALHGAGIERGGRGWVFAGPSNAGKSTAVGFSAGARSLGDDFAVILPAGDRFAVAAVPFDNSERVSEAAPTTAAPLRGVLRLRKARRHALRRPPRGLGAATLAACAAFPWALADLAERMLDAAAAIERAGLVYDLEFARDAGFWELLDELD